MNRDVKLAGWKMTYLEETLKIFRKSNKKYLVPDIEEEIITTSEPEDNMPVHVIPCEGEKVRPKKTKLILSHQILRNTRKTLT